MLTNFDISTGCTGRSQIDLMADTITGNFRTFKDDAGFTSKVLRNFSSLEGDHRVARVIWQYYMLAGNKWHLQCRSPSSPSCCGSVWAEHRPQWGQQSLLCVCQGDPQQIRCLEQACVECCTKPTHGLNNGINGLQAVDIIWASFFCVQ